MMKALIVVAVMLPAGVSHGQESRSEWLRDCQSSRNDRRNRLESFCEVRELRGPATGGTVSIDGVRNGGVAVTGWDRDSVSFEVRIQTRARSKAEARTIAGQVSTSLRGSRVEVGGPRNENDHQWSASVAAMIPRRSDLDFGTSNGPVTVTQIRGSVDVRTSNGPMMLRDLGGTVRARTTNAPLTISLGGTRWDGTGMDARTTNGPLTLQVPAGYNAHLELGTTNGPVSLDFPITVVGRLTKDISTDLGSGGATVRAMTTNGPLSVQRK
ncbi:MAG: hypothetical protein ABIS03_07745 [Gemmatimonadaceae bacterium]